MSMQSIIGTSLCSIG